MPRHGGKEDFCDGIIVAVDLAVDDGVERSFFRHRPQSLGDEGLSAQRLTAGVPFLERCRGGEIEILVFEDAKLPDPGVLRLLAFGQDASRVGVGSVGGKGQGEEQDGG